MRKNKALLGILFLCFTLGLAPYTPEPHLWGKLKWIMGGFNGMQISDWFDLLLHSLPWLLLIYFFLRKAFFRKK